MASYAPQINTFIARIVTIIGGVSGIATKQVHNGDRDLFDPASWEQHFWDNTDDHFAGWMVDWRRASNFPPPEGATAQLRMRDHEIIIKGWSQVDDFQTGQANNSAIAWRLLVATVCQTLGEDLWSNTPLSSTNCIGGTFPEVQFNELKEVILGDDGEQDPTSIKCHYCEISFIVRERAVWS